MTSWKFFPTFYPCSMIKIGIQLAPSSRRVDRKGDLVKARTIDSNQESSNEISTTKLI